MWYCNMIVMITDRALWQSIVSAVGADCDGDNVELLLYFTSHSHFDNERVF